MFWNRKWNPAWRTVPVSTVFDVRLALALQDDDPNRPMQDDQDIDIGLGFRFALGDMLNGRASEDCWSTCVFSLNLAMVLSEHGLGEEYLARINEALEGAFRAKIRAGRTGKWGFDGPAIQAIKEALEVHEEQLRIATKTEVRTALQDVRRRVEEGNVYAEAA